MFQPPFAKQLPDLHLYRILDTPITYSIPQYIPCTVSLSIYLICSVCSKLRSAFSVSFRTPAADDVPHDFVAISPEIINSRASQLCALPTSADLSKVHRLAILRKKCGHMAVFVLTISNEIRRAPTPRRQTPSIEMLSRFPKGDRGRKLGKKRDSSSLRAKVGMGRVEPSVLSSAVVSTLPPPDSLSTRHTAETFTTSKESDA